MTTQYCKGCQNHRDADQFEAGRAQCLTCRKKQNKSLAGVVRFERPAPVESGGLLPIGQSSGNLAQFNTLQK